MLTNVQTTSSVILCTLLEAEFKIPLHQQRSRTRFLLAGSLCTADERTGTISSPVSRTISCLKYWCSLPGGQKDLSTQTVFIMHSTWGFPSQALTRGHHFLYTFIPPLPLPSHLKADECKARFFFSFVGFGLLFGQVASEGFCFVLEGGCLLF